MSKSLGNFFIIRDILKLYHPEVVRFFIVRAQYRSQLNYSDAHLDDARAALTRLYTALRSFSLKEAQPDWSEEHAARFKAAMDDDFNTAEAVAELQKLSHLANNGDAKAAQQLRALGGVLGILQREPQEFLQAGHGAGPSEAEIEEKIAARLAARKATAYAEADRIRKALEAAGVMLEDGPKGTTWRRA
jgi:cysteinyl-tRNA synthetase